MNQVFYAGFYRFRRAPFHITPDSSLLFATQNHQQALGAVEYGIAAGKGFIVVTGEVGVGKTTVLRAVLDRLDPAHSRIIYIFNPDLTVAHLYDTILEGLDAPGKFQGDRIRTLYALQRALLRCHKSGMNVILAVDEAQNMPEATLEHLRILSNLETAKSKLLQIILVGQPELDEILRRRTLRQLAQRVAVRAYIGPLSFRQSCRYIQHRLVSAGRPTEPPLFTAPALWYLAYRARGVPRSLNIYSDNALINGYGHRAQRVTLSIVRESLRPLNARPRLPGPSIVYIAAAIIAVSVGLALVDFDALPAWSHSRRAETITIPLDSIAADSRPATPVKTTPIEPPQLTGHPQLTESPQQPTEHPQPMEPQTDLPETVFTVATHSSGAPGVVAAQTVGESTVEPPANTPVPPVPVPDMPAQNSQQNATAPVTRWLVRPGDNLIKACRQIYGECDPAKLKQVYASNPYIDSAGAIRPGDVIVFPDDASRAN